MPDLQLVRPEPTDPHTKRDLIARVRDLVQRLRSVHAYPSAQDLGETDAIEAELDALEADLAAQIDTLMAGIYMRHNVGLAPVNAQGLSGQWASRWDTRRAHGLASRK